MAKKKKYDLERDDTIEYDLIGLSSHHSDYRLAWSINSCLGIKLEKCAENFEFYNRKDELQSKHSMYYFQDSDERTEFYLIKNKSEGKFLIAEKPAIDFFLFLNNNCLNLEELITKMREVPSILGVYAFNPEELESTENIVFN